VEYFITDESALFNSEIVADSTVFWFPSITDPVIFPGFVWAFAMKPPRVKIDTKAKIFFII
jgi:hypothetical protein